MTTGTFFHPGPTEVRPEILATLAQPMIPHRGPAMREMMQRIHERLPSLFGTARPVYVATCAATALMDAAIRCAAPRRVLALVSGGFGERFAVVAERCGREVTRVMAAPGDACALDDVAAALAAGPYDAVTAVHIETSTGVLADLQALATLVRQYDETLLLVDAVSSVGGARVAMDAWKADLVFSASQKALALPPGLAFAACSERLLARARTQRDRGFYLDLVRCDEFWQRGEMAPSPPVSLIYALDAQLEAIAREGLEQRLARHDAMARATWHWADDMAQRGVPVRLLAPVGRRATTVSCLVWPDDPAGVARAMAARGFAIGGGYGALAGHTFRIGHLGDHSVEALERMLGALGETLAGWPTPAT